MHGLRYDYIDGRYVNQCRNVAKAMGFDGLMCPGIGSITTLSALAIFRCKLVVQKHLHPPNRVSAFTNRSVRLGQRQAALLLTSIWTYALAVTCPPLLGWGHYGREAAHIRYNKPSNH